MSNQQIRRIAMTVCAVILLVNVLVKDKKKWAWALMLIPVIVGITRIIRCVHYPSDVLGGMICGVIAGLIGYVVSAKLSPMLSGKSR